MGFGTVECVVSGIQFLLWIAPVIVKQTLRLLRLRALADRLPECGFGTLKILAHKTLALALQVILGGILVFFRPDRVVSLYDGLGLQRHRVSALTKEVDYWSRQASETARQILIQMAPAMKEFKRVVNQYPLPFISAATFFTVLGARLVFNSFIKPVDPLSDPRQLMLDLQHQLLGGGEIFWSRSFIVRSLIASAMFSVFLSGYRKRT